MKNIAEKILKYKILPLRNRIKYYGRTQRKLFLTVKEVCDILGAEYPKGWSSEDPRMNIRAFICFKNMFFVKPCIYFSKIAKDISSLDKVVKSGAVAIISESQIDNYPCIVVPDAREAYIKLIAAYRKKIKTPAVAVTGSTGKTSCKNMINSCLSANIKTFCMKENMNTCVFCGSLIQAIKQNVDAYIQECDEGDPNSTTELSTMLNPQVAVITNIGVSHFQNFKSIEEIRDNILGISDNLRDDGILVLNGDDELLANLSLKQKIVYYGIKNKQCECVADNITIDGSGKTHFELKYKGKTTGIQMSVCGEHNVYNAMAAFIVADYFNCPVETAVKGIKSFRSKGVRQNVFKVKGGTIYMDCFNAAPASIKTAVKTFEQIEIHPKSKRIAVLGDISELGTISEDMHREVGRFVAESNVDVLIAYGNNAKYIAEAAKNGKAKVEYASTESEAKLLLKKNYKRGDAVLFKSSRSMKMERVMRSVFPVAYFFKVFLGDILLFHDI